MRTFARITAAILLSAVVATAHAGDKPLTVVELYTSQGCSSCPPADAFLGKLAKRDDIIALSLHVDYWDYIGWKDPYALHANTARQRAYARNLGMGYVYTPQMVVQGMAHTTGSNSYAVESLIKDLQGAKRLAVELKRVGDKLEIIVPGGSFDERARILVAAFDARHENDVSRGENSGRKLAHTNVVRALEDVGGWSGGPVSLDVGTEIIDLAGRDGCAVLVQSEENGRILGAAKIEFKPKS